MSDSTERAHDTTRDADWKAPPLDIAALLAREAAMREALRRTDGLLSRVLHELAGAASLCWDPRPAGVFDSQEAIKHVEGAIAELRASLASAPGEAPAPAEETVPVPRVVAWSGGKAPYRFIRVILDDTPTEHEYVPRAEAPAPAQTLCGHPSCNCKRDPPPDPAYCARGFPTREAPAVPTLFTLAAAHEAGRREGIEATTELIEVVGQILDAGHLNTEDLARLRAAWERAQP